MTAHLSGEEALTESKWSFSPTPVTGNAGCWTDERLHVLLVPPDLRVSVALNQPQTTQCQCGYGLILTCVLLGKWLTGEGQSWRLGSYPSQLKEHRDWGHSLGPSQHHPAWKGIRDFESLFWLQQNLWNLQSFDYHWVILGQREKHSQQALCRHSIILKSCHLWQLYSVLQ